jgi:hypothetical protein
MTAPDLCALEAAADARCDEEGGPNAAPVVNRVLT